MVRSYPCMSLVLCRSEPLAGHGALFRGDGRPAWKVLRLETVQYEDDDETLSATLRPDPFLFVGLYPDLDVQSQRARQLFDATKQFHVQQNVGEQASRVAMLGRLLAVDPAAEERLQRRAEQQPEINGADEEKEEVVSEDEEQENEEEEGQVVGVLTLFSAKSVRDAERYIRSADSAASSAAAGTGPQMYKESVSHCSVFAPGVCYSVHLFGRIS